MRSKKRRPTGWQKQKRRIKNLIAKKPLDLPIAYSKGELYNKRPKERVSLSPKHRTSDLNEMERE